MDHREEVAETPVTNPERGEEDDTIPLLESEAPLGTNSYEDLSEVTSLDAETEVANTEEASEYSRANTAVTAQINGDVDSPESRIRQVQSLENLQAFVESSPVQRLEVNGNSTYIEYLHAQKFIRNVFIIYAAELLAIIGIIMVFTENERVRLLFPEHKKSLMFLVPAISSILGLIFLIHLGFVMRRPSHNVTALGFLALCLGSTIGSLSATFGIPGSTYIFIALFGVSIGFIAFSLQKKRKYDAEIGGIISLCMSGLVFLMLIALFEHILAAGLYCLASFFFGIYLGYDTSVMLKRKHRYKISLDEFSYAALRFNIDIYIYILDALFILFSY